MKLLAYKINGQTINIDIFNWSYTQLDGNEPWIISETFILLIDINIITIIKEQ
jgi:hypothetical protein